MSREPYSESAGYILTALGFLGVAGAQHFYMGRPLKGIIYFVTGGLFSLGTIYDLLTMKTQIREANMRLGFRDAFELPPRRTNQPYTRNEEYSGSSRAPFGMKKTLEQTILTTARNNKGITSPSMVALEANISVDEAKNYLDKLVDKGYAEVRVKKTGSLVYVFPDFLEPSTEDDLEDF